MNPDNITTHYFFLFYKKAIEQAEAANSYKDAFVPIVLSAFAIESFLNSLPLFCAEEQELKLLKKTLNDNLQTASPQDKFRITYALLKLEHVTENDKAVEILAHIDTVMRLRNFIAHKKPSNASADVREKRRIDAHSPKWLKRIKPILQDEIQFRSEFECLQPVVAKWAANVAFNSMVFVSKLFPSTTMAHHSLGFALSDESEPFKTTK